MTKRYLSLDILRGLTVAMMIVVNNPGSWEHIFPPLRHASWDGCTPCDLVFPFFLFCVGTSMAFALAGYSSLTGDALKKIFKRGALMFLIGLGLNAFPFYPSASSMDPDLSFWQNWAHWVGGLRIFGILQRIALCYVLGSVLVLWLQKPKKIAMALASLCVAEVALLLIFAGPEGAFSLQGNFARRLDLALLGERHLYHGYGIPFDPEGIYCSLTGTCTVFLGYLTGKMIRSNAASYAETSNIDNSPVGVVSKLFVLSAASLLLGLFLSIWIPINKPIWSVSYVFYAGGWAMFVLAIFAYLIDVKGWEKPFLPFKAFGMNALALFVLSSLNMKIIWRFTSWDYTHVFGVNEGMSLLFSLLYMLFHLLVAVVLYRKKIFIKL